MAERRYVTAMNLPATSWWEVDGSTCLARTVHETEAQPVDTGLLDANGVKLYAVEERRIGFIHHKSQ